MDSLKLSKHDLSVKYRVVSTVNHAAQTLQSWFHCKIKYIWKAMDAAECCVICTTNENLPVQKSEEKYFTNSSLGIRIITYNYVAFSRFFVFVQIIGNKIEGERASLYFSNCGTREEIRRGWCCSWSVWRIRNQGTGVGFTGRCCRYYKLVGCRRAGGGFHVLGADQHDIFLWWSKDADLHESRLLRFLWPLSWAT